MISVIVPVYKVEKYIHRCVESIINQSYKDYELILVDDGSPDSCPQICDRYAERYCNIKTIHKANGGPSDARNAGTDIAKGEYVTYIDSDDYVEETYLEVLWGLINRYQADIAVGGTQVVFSEKTLKKNKKGMEFLYSGIEALEHVLYQDTLDTNAWGVLLPIKIAKKYPFPYGRYHEDDLTTYKYYAEARKVVVTTQPLYFYYQRNGSITHTFGQANLDELDAADNFIAVCERSYPHLMPAALSKKFSDYCQVLLSNVNLKKEYPEQYFRILRFLNTAKRDILLDPKVRRKNKLAAFSLLFGQKGFLYVARLQRKISDRNV